MEVAKADVEDWIIRTDEEIYGGYTARVALADMPKEQATNTGRCFRDCFFSVGCLLRVGGLNMTK